MESGETQHEQPEMLWLPRHTREVPEELRSKQVTEIYFPETPEERRAAWTRPSESAGEGGVGWVGIFDAEYTDRRGHVVFLASGSSEHPGTEITLAFSDSEWDAFLGGARLKEFDRFAAPCRPRSLGIIALLILISAGPMLGRNRPGSTAV